jgi:hypothetical protein
VDRLEDTELVAKLKSLFAPDGGAEREHNAAEGTLGFGAIHYSLVANLKPQRALVIGSRYGYIPAVIALALGDGGGGVDFVDANYSDGIHGFEKAFGGVGHWGGDASARFAGSGLEDLIHVHIARSEEFFAGCQARYGYVYLDGDHSYQGCRFDFEQAVRFAEDNALITLHDAAVTDPAFGVGRLFQELDPELYGKILVPTWPGLAIVQVRQRGYPPA